MPCITQYSHCALLVENILSIQTSGSAGGHILSSRTSRSAGRKHIEYSNQYQCWWKAYWVVELHSSIAGGKHIASGLTKRATSAPGGERRWSTYHWSASNENFAREVNTPTVCCIKRTNSMNTPMNYGHSRQKKSRVCLCVAKWPVLNPIISTEHVLVLMLTSQLTTNTV